MNPRSTTHPMNPTNPMNPINPVKPGILHLKTDQGIPVSDFCVRTVIIGVFGKACGLRVGRRYRVLL